MMEALFSEVLRMSIYASFIIIAVVILRLVLKKAPKWQLCALWGLVAVRLVCHVTIESEMSIIPNTEKVYSLNFAGQVDIENMDIADRQPIKDNMSSVNDNSISDAGESLNVNENSGAYEAWTLPTVAGKVWIAGMVVMLAYMLISYVRTRKRTAISIRVRDNIFVCDEVNTPFILGIFRPRIYLPSNLEIKQQNYVLEHEFAHLKRHDHLWKLMGFILLIVYWFNPLCWLAYMLFSRDLEYACDEKVIRNYDLDKKKSYSKVLLLCSVSNRNLITGSVTFGDVGAKKRVKEILGYKKSSISIVILTLVAGIVIAVCMLTEPVKEKETDDEQTETASQLSEYYKYPVKDYMHASVILDVCRIPGETLESMSSEQLAQAVVDFPLLFDVYTSSLYPFDTRTLKNESDAYRELLTREDAKEAFISKIKEVANGDYHEAVVRCLKEIALYEKEFSDLLSEEDIEYLSNK